MAKTLFKGFSTVQGPKTRKLHDIISKTGFKKSLPY